MTDEYEGHTAAPWADLLNDGMEDLNGWDTLMELGFNDEARRLIADAPHLLQEVKRLRRQVLMLLKNSTSRMERLSEHGISDPVWEEEHGADEYTGRPL